MKIRFENFTVRECTPENISEILQIQEETFETLSSPDLLRKNTPEMLSECLKYPHQTIGAWYQDELAAFAMRYTPEGNAEEDLSLLLQGVNLSHLKPANFKLCIVRPSYKGNSLQFHLGALLEQYAKNAGIGLMCATVHPENTYSINNLLKLGYSYNRTLEKYGLERNLYFKFISFFQQLE